MPKVFATAATGDLKAVQAYMDANPHHLNCRSIFQSTLLHVAARNGHLAIVKDLLQRGITIDAPDHVNPPLTLRSALLYVCLILYNI